MDGGASIPKCCRAVRQASSPGIQALQTSGRRS